jgi:hypothetical protein
VQWQAFVNAVMNLRFVFRMEGGSYDCVCCKNTLIVFIDGSEIRAFGKLPINRYEGTKTKVPIFLSLVMGNLNMLLSVPTIVYCR